HVDSAIVCYRVTHTEDAYYVFFFFQAEDGIRDFHVTGVQTCALPIYHRLAIFGLLQRRQRHLQAGPGIPAAKEHASALAEHHVACHRLVQRHARGVAAGLRIGRRRQLADARRQALAGAAPQLDLGGIADLELADAVLRQVDRDFATAV